MEIKLMIIGAWMNLLSNVWFLNKQIEWNLGNTLSAFMFYFGGVILLFVGLYFDF